MTTGGTGTSGGGRPGRGVDVAAWLLVIAALIGVAAALAWYLSNVSFTIREVTLKDDSVDVDLMIPVAPAAEPSPSDRPPSPGPAAADALNSEGVTPPVWIRQPAPLYPVRALQRGIDRGEVMLQCSAFASGALGACSVLRESPPGAGFAEAALASTRQARVEPRTVNGVRTDSRIAYTVRFQLAEP